MPRYVGTVRSPRPVEEVFDYLARFDNVAEWDPSIERAEQLDPAPPRRGSRFRILFGFLGRETALEYELVECERPRLLVLRAETDSIRSLDTIEFTSLPGGGSQLTYDAELELNGWRKLAALPVAAAFSFNNRRAAARLRERLAA
jgi:uncharacterized protein YndB with AHSA1/START domain